MVVNGIVFSVNDEYPFSERRGVMKHTRHGQYYTLTYRVWCGMKSRCNNKNHKDYILYGAKGIGYDPRWEEFVFFLDDMGHAPAGHSLDRIDYSLGYSKDNCRWATPKQQARNTNRNKFIEYKDETKCLAEWCEILGLNYGNTQMRLSRGYSIEDAFTLPMQKTGPKKRTL